MKFLIITSEPGNWVPVELKKAAEKLGHELDIVNILKCSAEFNGKVMISKDDGNVELSKYDVCITRLNKEHLIQKYFILRAVERKYASYVVNPAEGMYICQDKLQAYDKAFEMLAQHPSLKARIPKTVIPGSRDAVSSAQELMGPAPSVIKTNYGSGGRGVMLGESDRSVKSILGYAADNDDAMLQEYIEHDASYRIVIVLGEVLCANKRNLSDSDFRSNSAYEVEAEAYEPSKNEVDTCRAWADLVKVDFCSVDYTLKDDNVILFEINGSTGLEAMQKCFEDRVLCEEIIQKLATRGEVGALSLPSEPDFEKHADDHVEKMAAATGEPTEAPPTEPDEVVPVPPPVDEEPHKVTVPTEIEIGIPPLSVEKLEAKVDTGAESCSLHGKDIKLDEERGTVEFDYEDRRFKMWYDRIIVVKNANGEERRAIVILSIQYNGTTYNNIETTIADRSDMNYKFLVGKNLLSKMNASVEVSKSEEE